MSKHKAPGWVKGAARLYESGYSLSQIAPIVNRAPTTVRDQLKQAGIELRSSKEGIRLRTWQDNGTLGLSFEPSELTLSLIGFGVGDGHLCRDRCTVAYIMKPTIVRDHIAYLLRGLGLRPSTAQLLSGVWEVRTCDVRWVEFNKPFFTNHNYLRSYALAYPTAFVQGLFAAEGSHCIRANGSIDVRLSNTSVLLLSITAECFGILNYNTSLHILSKKAHIRSLNILGSNLTKAKLMTTSPWPNKRVPSNYLVRRSLLKSEIRNIYDQALEELYTTYGKERVNKELLPAKNTGEPYNKRTTIPILRPQKEGYHDRSGHPEKIFEQ